MRDHECSCVHHACPASAARSSVRSCPEIASVPHGTLPRLCCYDSASQISKVVGIFFPGNTGVTTFRVQRSGLPVPRCIAELPFLLPHIRPQALETNEPLF